MNKIGAHMFKLRKLTITNYKGIRNTSIGFQDHLNVFVGENGTGKSSILNCIALVFSYIYRELGISNTNSTPTETLEISNGESFFEIVVNCTINEYPLKLSIRASKKGGISTQDDYYIIKKLYPDFANDGTKWPLGIYYSSDRFIRHALLEPKNNIFDTIHAHLFSLSKTTQFNHFFQWFRNREDLENEHRINDSAYRDSQLTAVRTAIEIMLDTFSSMKVKRNPLMLVVKKEEAELAIEQLSDGERGLLTLVGDLARRMAIHSQDLSNPLKTKAVVLIDELELHLHPRWQRTLISKLRQIFPETQFITATHSPQIISHVQPESIFILHNDNGQLAATNPDSSYGLDCNRLLEDIMNTPDRPQVIKDKYQRLYTLIRDKELPKASELINSIQNDVKDDPELTRAKALLKRMETIGR